MKNIKYNLKIFISYSRLYLKIVFQSRLGIFLFTLGKIIRFLFFLGIIFIVFSKNNQIKGWSLNQVLLVYFVFNFLDTATQMLFREVYRFRSILISGNLDLILTKPHHPLLKVLFGGVDFLDFILLLPFFIILNYLLFLNFQGIINFLLFWVFVLNSFLILASFHILVLSSAIFTTDVDHSIFIYRDILRLGQFPIDIYKFPINFVFTFIIPVGIITFLPVKIFYFATNLKIAFLGLFFSLFFIVFSLKLWNKALAFYQSASS
ncbi:MAG: ABC-2 family transporter protein [Patescibacteria group bacterium]|nr:ABC-2 family transporter protein [Patescibacteria group bacterium]